MVDGWDHWMFNDYTWTSWHVGFSLLAQMLHVWILYLYERCKMATFKGNMYRYIFHHIPYMEHLGGIFPDFVMISIRCYPSSDYGAPSGIPSQAVARTAQDVHPGLGISSAVPPGERIHLGCFP